MKISKTKLSEYADGEEAMSEYSIIVNINNLLVDILGELKKQTPKA